MRWFIQPELSASRRPKNSVHVERERKRPFADEFRTRCGLRDVIRGYF